MEHLGNALKALFISQNGDDVLSSAGLLRDGKAKIVSDIVHLDSDLQESQIFKLLNKLNIYSTLDQKIIVGQVIISQWMQQDSNHRELAFFKPSVFNTLLYFACHTIFLEENEPVCHYSRLLRWHTVTTFLGEDIFTTALIASSDIKNGYTRTYFDWPAFIGHNNKELNALFNRPMADLHMHLKASSFNFDFSWLSVMNNITELRDKFEEVNTKRKYSDWDSSLYEKMYRASAIRLYLASRTGLTGNCMGSSDLYKVLNPPSFEDLKKIMDNIPGYSNPMLDRILDNVKECAKNYDDRSPFQDVDYIRLHNYNKEAITSVLSSERELMYKVFSLILGDSDDRAEISTLFYAYLCYKTTFRQALVQLDSSIGFHNFTLYEKIKDAFVVDIYKRFLYKASIESFLSHGNGHNRYLETRIVPGEAADDIADKVGKIVDCVQADFKSNFTLILHFIKARDNREDKNYRHKLVREKIKRQAFAIYEFRNDTKYWCSEPDDFPLVGFIVGIDAANSEIYCRPEVFAHAFRFLRQHKIANEKERPKDLNITFHVGEDFYDVADGLRAIEEAMIFLNLRNGDRLGHCLALGTDVRNYYNKRYNTICTTKQVLLDNMAWLHHKCKRLLGYTPLSYYLETTFHQYFIEVYGEDLYKDGKFNYAQVFDSDLKTMDDIQDYYQSWLLRGNSPTFAADMDKVPDSELEREWLYSSENHHIGAELAKNNKNALEIFERYHNDSVVKKGSEAVTFTIRSEYRDEFYKLLEAIQQHLLNKIEKKRIAIECNPSSNIKIGEMNSYDEHPILKFFNSGLNTPYPEHAISVSINTDDQGIFATSLEREYSLMALALERSNVDGCHNSPRQIFDWLDKIRQMSIEQKFDSRNM